MLQQTSEEVAECLRRAAEAEACAEATNNAKFKAEYQRIAQTWRTLARGYEFEGSLGRFISFNESRKKALPFIPPANRQTIPSTAATTAAKLAWHNDAETILRNTPFLLARCSSDLRYVFVSEALARMLGHCPEELVGKKNRRSYRGESLPDHPAPCKCRVGRAARRVRKGSKLQGRRSSFCARHLRTR
jgi:PAS domain-containing protein